MVCDLRILTILHNCLIIKAKIEGTQKIMH